jgi:hypothetical protein
MKRKGYKGFVIEARVDQLRNGKFSVEFSIEQHDARGVTEKRFYIASTFLNQESAIEAAIQAGQLRIDASLEHIMKLMKHPNIRWNPATKEWFCTRCGRTSDHISVQDAHVELNQYECDVPSVEPKPHRRE